MAALRFLPSLIDRIIVLNVKKHLTQTTERTIPAKERDVRLVHDLTARTMFQEHSLGIVVRTATRSFMVLHANTIIFKTNSANPSKLAQTVKVSTW